MATALSFGAYLADLMLAPFQGSTLTGLLLVSILLGVVLVWIYGKVSAQARLKSVKDGISAAIYEAVLYRHDLRLLLAAQGRLFGGAGRYLAVAAPPLLILGVPCVILLAGLNDRFEARGLRQGEGVQVDLKAPQGTSFADIKVTGSPSVKVSAPVRQEARGLVSFWVERTGPADARFSVEMGGVSPVTGALARAEVSTEVPVSYSVRSLWMRLLYPREGGTLSAPFESVAIAYPARHQTIFGYSAHWLLIFFVVSMIAGLLGSRVLRIEI